MTTYLRRFVGIAIVALVATMAPVTAASADSGTGTLVVHAVDATFGGDIPEFCATLTGSAGLFSQCTFDGEIQFALPAGDYSMDVAADQTQYLGLTDVHIHVVDNQTQEFTAGMVDVAVIDMQVEDRATGEVAPFVCVSARLRTIGGFNAWTESSCGDEFGTVQLAHLPAGTYDLFVKPDDGVHGMQWIGPSGGVGRENLAASFTIAAGQTLWTPPVRLDKAGSIAGVVTDQVTGQAIADAAVSVLPTSRNSTGGTPDSVPVDATGHYLLSGLGPYTWPVETVSSTHAWQFGTGSTHNRFSASTIKVTVNSTATFNPTMVSGGALTGVVRTHANVPVANAWVFVDNGTTGDDVAAWVRTDASGHFTVPHVAAQSVRVGVYTGVLPLAWYHDQPTFATATFVTITNGATKNLTIKVPTA